MVRSTVKNVVWDTTALKTNIKNLPARVQKLIIATVELNATRGVAWMKQRAKWTDRTGNARNTLHVDTLHENTREGSRHTMTFAHGMPYGIWLELRFSGKYAIIMSSTLRYGQLTMNGLSGGMGKIK